MSDLRKIRWRIDVVYDKKFDELFYKSKREEISIKEYDIADLMARIEHLYLMGCLSNQEFEEYYIDPYKYCEDESIPRNECMTDAMNDLKETRRRVNFVYDKKCRELYYKYLRKEILFKENFKKDSILRIECLYLLGYMSTQEFEEYYKDPKKFFPFYEEDDESNSVNENKTKVPRDQDSRTENIKETIKETQDRKSVSWLEKLCTKISNFFNKN
eukprot:TRINITY_DN1450_c0_g1_i10.p1 TRINITY_DN1450_c0_g1~~TRINITY_DN1450_c0_g1_i10.p1  ORF type:complete len:215 (-),score=28.99 TRINITY_DN1450_c0_g1_i10:128-772(-)